MRNLLAAPLPPHLAESALRLAGQMRQGRLNARECAEVVDVVVEMTDHVVGYFFVQPVDAMGLGLASRKIAHWGVSSSMKTLHYGLRKALPRLDARQWRMVGDLLERSLVDAGAARR